MPRLGCALRRAVVEPPCRRAQAQARAAWTASSSQTHPSPLDKAPYSLSPSSSSNPFIRSLRPQAEAESIHHDDFLFWPEFFNPHESIQLVQLALWKLDRADSTLRRRSWKPAGEGESVPSGESDVQGMFKGEYGFEEGHFDSVIHHYRETLLSSLPPHTSPLAHDLLTRLYALLPTNTSTSLPSDEAKARPEESSSEGTLLLPPPLTSTHLLHLAPHGDILPHVDNLQASGSVILGLSLGAERILRLEKDGGGQGQGWDVRLPSGSVYLQRDRVRYEYKHSILPYSHPDSSWDGRPLTAGHRISIMIRDAPPSVAQL